MKSPIAVLLLIAGTLSAVCFAQTTPDMATGLSPYAEYIPNDIDNVNPVNGNIFLKIPLVSFPQRGGKLRLDYYIYYNDKQWQLYFPPLPGEYGNYNGFWNLGDGWGPNEISSVVGAYVARDQYAQYQTDYVQYGHSYGDAGDLITISTLLSDTYVMTPDGGRHYVGDGFDQTCSSQGVGVCPTMPSIASESYPATDASGYDQYGHDPSGVLYTAGSSSSVPYTVSDPNGNTISASSTGLTDTFGRQIPGTLTGPGTFPFPNSQIYINGTTVTNDDLVPGVPVSTSPNTNIPSSCPTGTSFARTWTIPGSQSYNSGKVTYNLCYALYSYQTAFNLDSYIDPPSGGLYTITEASSTTSGGNGQALMLVAIVLPDGNSYTFGYDQYLSLIQLGLPTGGSISYTWQNVLFKPVVSSTSAPISRALATRTLKPGNGQPSSTYYYQWNIAYANTQNGVAFPAYSIETDPNGNDVEYTLGGPDDVGTVWDDYVNVGEASYSGCSPHDPSAATSTPHCSPKAGSELSATTYALTPVYGGGAAYGTPSFIPQLSSIPPTKPVKTTTHLSSTQGMLLSTRVNGYAPPYGNCSVYTYPVNMYTANGLESGISNTGGSAPAPTLSSGSNCFSTGQTASTAVYDYGAPGSGKPGPLLKTEFKSYAWQPTVTPGSPPDFAPYTNNATYLRANLLDLVYQDEVMDAGNNFAAETAFGYDASPSPSGAHGNQTSVSRYVSSSSSIASSMQYNSSGIPTLAIDPKGNETYFGNFACNGALPQTVTKAYGSTTTLPETSTYSYDCNIGKVITVKDPNSQTTTFAYSDPLSRVSSVTYPDTGGETVNYSDATAPNTFPLTMTTTTLTGETAGPAVKTTTYDGLGRKTLSQFQTSSTSTKLVTTATNYDNMGRVYTVSNPYYTGDATSGLTTYYYDALSRKTKQLDSDGTSSQLWSYNGATTGYSDENGDQWQRTIDALGRLTVVMEPNGLSQAGSMVTNYGYDALSNLLSANQWGGSQGSAGARVRSFSYDGLSRLLSATNPETGTTKYTYDNNSNVILKTDSRGVGTTFGYDALNRILSKTYSGDTSSTPSSCYQYDLTSVTNGVGRLSATWTQSATAGSCSTSAAYWAKRAILVYDAMGRIKSEQQFTPSNHGSSAPYALAYTYDLAGNLISSTNGTTTTPSVGTLSFSNTFDAAGRLFTTKSNWSDPTHPATLFSLPTSPTLACAGSLSYPYAAFGGLMNATFGSGLTLNRAYDDRLRTVCENDAGSAVGSSGTNGTVTVTIPGAEQSN